MINIQPIEKQRAFDDGSSLTVQSIFYTIQGEGVYAGHPAVFIRLAGCNLMCPHCDTDYTSRARELHLDYILQYVKRSWPEFNKGHKLVVITGGEPFRQNISPLTNALINDGFHVQIETNGTLAPPPGFPIEATVVCSPKAGKVNQALWPHIDVYKYVLDHKSVGEDGLPLLALGHTAKPWVARPHEGFNGPVYLQPMDPKDDGLYLSNVGAVKQSCLKYGHILQLQVHKIINVE